MSGREILKPIVSKIKVVRTNIALEGRVSRTLAVSLVHSKPSVFTLKGEAVNAKQRKVKKAKVSIVVVRNVILVGTACGSKV